MKNTYFKAARRPFPRRDEELSLKDAVIVAEPKPNIQPDPVPARGAGAGEAEPEAFP